MLQQTQVLRVIGKFSEFIERYPTVRDLAQASAADVLRLWKGMGYNRRALYLKGAAEAIVRQYQGKFPKDEVILAKLPGLGTYTARAILVFAFRQNIAMVDTNIRQIITHFFFRGKPQKEKVIQEIADQLLPKGKSWEWHQALMDYGALRLARARSGQAPKSKKSPFRDSSRFYRGRIVDRLRDGETTKQLLMEEFRAKYQKDAVFVNRIIEGLHKDGLLHLSDETISLPH